MGRLVAAWAERGAALPVAVVVSIFDDLLEDAPLFARAVSRIPSQRPLALDDIAVDRTGFARLFCPVEDAVLELVRLLQEALSGPSGGDGIPPAAQALLRHGTSDDRWVRPANADALRRWLRSALGPPAARQEVSALVEAASQPPLAVPSAVPSGAPSLIPPVEVEIPILSAIEQQALTPQKSDNPVPVQVPVRVPTAPPIAPPIAPPTALPIAAPLAKRPSQPAALPPSLTATELEEPPALFPRTVVRHPPNRSRPVSLPAAPPARLRARGGGDPAGSFIQVPTAGRSWTWLKFILLVLAIMMFALMLRPHP
jgi:hypothetical protein